MVAIAPHAHAHAWSASVATSAASAFARGRHGSGSGLGSVEGEWRLRSHDDSVAEDTRARRTMGTTRPPIASRTGTRFTRAGETAPLPKLPRRALCFRARRAPR